MSLTTGMRLGRYRLESRVGSGGMAEVWKAQDEILHRTVAVKVVLETVSREPTFTERFVREARTIAGLEHSNILPIYDFGSEGESVYLVMPLVTGGCLKDRLGAPVPPAQAIAWISGVASALDYAHARGILHRDVKPANVLLDKSDKPLLSDFGLAKSVGDSIAGLTATGSVMGTPAYMSPEQALGLPLDARADQYSLGVIAFQLLSGVVPFKADSPLVVLNKHLQEPPPRPSDLNPKLSTTVDRALERALRKNAAERYASCEAFSAALGEAFGPMSDSEAPTSRMSSAESRRASLPPLPSQGGGGKRRAPLVAIGVGAAALALALAAWSLLRPKPQRVAAAPTPAPTAIAPAPTAVPTAAPAPEPTAVPTAAPAPQPTAAPHGAKPTAAPAPTAAPPPRTVEPKATNPPPPPERPTASPATAPGDAVFARVFENGQRAFAAGAYREASTAFREAVSEAERFGRSDPRLPRSLQRLGMSVANLARYAEAGALLRRSLEIYAAQPDAAALDVADSQISLGFVLSREGKGGAEAEGLIQKGLASKEKVLGPRAPAVAFALQQLAYLEEMQYRHAEAESHLKRALAIYGASAGEHEASRAAVLNDLGWLHTRKGEPRLAEPRLREALAIRQRVLPAGHPAIAQTLQVLAVAQAAQHRPTEAEPLLRQALAIREKALGPDNLLVAQTLEELARVLRQLRRGAEADRLLARAGEIRGKTGTRP